MTNWHAQAELLRNKGFSYERIATVVGLTGVQVARYIVSVMGPETKSIRVMRNAIISDKNIQKAVGLRCEGMSYEHIGQRIGHSKTSVMNKLKSIEGFDTGFSAGSIRPIEADKLQKGGMSHEDIAEKLGYVDAIQSTVAVYRFRKRKRERKMRDGRE